MSVDVEEWKHTESHILTEVSRGLAAQAAALDAVLHGLVAITNVVYDNEVSGPPANYLHGIWDTFYASGDGANHYPALLRELSATLGQQATHWEQSYEAECRAREAEEAAERQQQQQQQQQQGNGNTLSGPH